MRPQPQSQEMWWAKQISQRIFPVLMLLNLILVFVLAIVDPRGFFIFSVPAACFNLYMMTKVGVFSVKGLGKLKRGVSKDYYKRYLEKKQHSTHMLNWDEVVHYVVMPNYREPEDILIETLQRLSNCKLAKTHVIPCLAMEEREEGAAEKAQALMERTREWFKDIIYTIHPGDLPGELKGKASNEGWAVDKIFEDITARGLSTDDVAITICDADSSLPTKYFEALNYKFCSDQNRHFKIFQSAMICYKNYGTTPFPTRMMSMAVSMHEIAALQDKLDLHIPFSTYSLSATLLKTTGGYDRDVIAEDWHEMLKSYFNSGGKITVVPLPLPVYSYAVEADSWWSSVKARFTQAVRHSFAVSEVGYFFYKAYESYFAAKKKQRKPSILKTMAIGVKIISVHYYAAFALLYVLISVCLIGAYSYIPGLNNTERASSVTNNWSLVFKVLNTLALIPTLLSLYSHVRVVQMCLGEQYYGKWIWLKGIQWGLELAIFQIPVSLALAAIPTFYCLARLLFTDKLDYVTAPKPPAITTIAASEDSVALNVQFEKLEDESSTESV